MSPRGPYDFAISKISEADLHYAEKDKNRSIEVTDSIYDHHLDSDIERHKKIITAQSDYDMERHNYD